MGVRIPMSVDNLGRSRFAITPSVEVAGSILGRGRRREQPHLTRRRQRAESSLSRSDLALLHALLPVDHPYSPDFLTPRPVSALESIDDLCEQIAKTPEDQTSYQLDISFSGREVWPDVASSFGSLAAYERWRRPMPTAIEQALDGGLGAFTSRIAEAVRSYFDIALAPEWSQVVAVMQDDIAYRGSRMATAGTLAIIDDLAGDIGWSEGAVRIDRPYDVLVDWADDGLILMPTSTESSRVKFSAERPNTPTVIYPVRGVAALWRVTVNEGPAALSELIGETRATLLANLDEPRSTQQLSGVTRLSAATVSYHLAILHRSGLVRKRRRGRAVVYSQAPLAETLL